MTEPRDPNQLDPNEFDANQLDPSTQTFEAQRNAVTMTGAELYALP